MNDTPSITTSLKLDVGMKCASGSRLKEDALNTSANLICANASHHNHLSII